MCGGNGAQPFKFQKVINKVNYVCLTEDLQRDLFTLSFKREAFTYGNQVTSFYLL